MLGILSRIRLYLGMKPRMAKEEAYVLYQQLCDEVSRHLAGIIFIDDNSIKEDSYSCNVIMNPNALNVHSIAEHYLMSLVENGDKRGLYDDLKYDNY